MVMAVTTLFYDCTAWTLKRQIQAAKMKYLQYPIWYRLQNKSEQIKNN